MLLTAYAKIVPGAHKIPNAQDICWLWQNTAQNSKLRSLVIDSIAVADRLTDFNPADLSLPAEFYLSLVRHIPIIRTDLDCKKWQAVWVALDICDYHGHQNGINCRGEKMEDAKKESFKT